MNEVVLSIRITDPLLREALLQAERTGVSIETWLLSIAEDRIRDERVTERFFNRAPQESDGRKMLEVLDSLGD